MISKTQGWRLIRCVLPNVLAVGIVFLLGGVLIEIAGESAFEIYRILWNSTFGSLDDFGYVLFNATPLIFDLIPTTIRMSTPLILTALGGIYSERSGVVNIALEGMMLMGTFGYVMGTQALTSTWLGLTIGMSFGAAIALLHAIAAITFRAD